MITLAARWGSLAPAAANRTLCATRGIASLGHSRKRLVLGGLSAPQNLANAVPTWGTPFYNNSALRLVVRGLSGSGVPLEANADEERKRRSDFQDLFAEARLCIADAEDSMGTTYYNEDAEDAQAAVKECLESYQALVADFGDEARGQFLRENSQKVKQLEAELEHILDHDH